MNTTIEYFDPYPFEDFAPTLSQCFVLVIVGYLLSRLEILTASDVKGVISLANYFAIPGIICVSLMDADFSDFRWELLFGIFLGKFITFVIIAGFCMMLKGDIGVAAVVSLFCTQSNDLPVGNPLMSSLYRDYRPEMMKYLFLIPSMTVILFVPVTNIMLSAHGAKKKRIKLDEFGVRKCWWKYIKKEDISKEIHLIAKNPVVIATVCGLALNFAMVGDMPEVLHQPISVAAATIPGIALVMLGFSFVRKEKYLLSSAIVPATALFIYKIVITPILLHFILKILTEDSKSAKLLSDFALLYGIISPATTIFLSGREFRKALAVMSVALILSSFCCFPVSYVVARTTIAPIQKLSSYVPVLKTILFWTAGISICCNAITGVITMWKNQWRQLSLYILYLLFAQIITCCGLILWSIRETQKWMTYCEVVLYQGGEISGYIWTGMLAVVLVFKHKNWILTKKGFFIISCTALSISCIITAILCLLMPHKTVQTVYVVGSAKSDFEFLQLIVSSILLFITLIVVAVCLTYHFKSNKIFDRKITDATAFENAAFYLENPEEIIQTQNSGWFEKVQEKPTENVETNVYRKDILKNRKFESNISIEEREWTVRLSSLLILMSLTMLVRFIANLFKLARSKALEVMIPMEFLQSTLFSGQGILIFLTLGVDVRTIIISLRKCCRKLIHWSDDIVASTEEPTMKDDEQIRYFCNHFYKFYYNRCFTDIAKERRWKSTVYKDSFWGHQLVDWLISEGLSQDDGDAEGQGQKLLEGGVIQHVSRKHHFYDAPYLYNFVKGNLDNDSSVKCLYK